VNGEPLARELLTEEIAELQASVAPELFSGFDPALFPMSSLRALALTARAHRSGTRLGELVSLALRDALFENGRDISDPSEITTIADAFGIGEPDVDDEAAVLADLEAGGAQGVVGSPHFFVEGAGFFCPTLSIERVDGQMEISFDPEGFMNFIDRCFHVE
jgi:predicted DsbA family dithiol-disulfide isomerase